MNLRVGHFEVNEGEKVRGFLPIAGTELKLPITIINGVKGGKNILITAGIHGCEYAGIETVTQLSNEIEPEGVCGSIILVHCANVSGFYKRCAAIVPEDGVNLNRVFPGDNRGTVSEKIANIITQELQMKADFYIDLHGGDLHELVTPYVYYPGVAEEEVSRISCEAAKKLSVPYRVKSSATTGAYNSAAILGIPSILIERGGCGLWSKEEVHHYKKDIYKLLGFFNVITGQGDYKQLENQIEITKAVYIDSEYDGYWYPSVNPGNSIEVGQLLGIIKDAFGNEIRRYNSELNGVVLYMTISLAIAKDQPLITCGEVGK